MPKNNSIEIIKGSKCAVTGAGGTVGSELCRQLIDLGASEVRALDNSETALWNLENELIHDDLRCYIVDVCNEMHVKKHFENIDFVFHAAALKHVPFCERQPHAAIETNVRGVESVINAAIACDVQRVLFTSSDKAVNSTNLMGATKFVGERIMTSANNLSANQSSTKFASSRFGNVALSNGSVIPRFIDQIKNRRPLTITDPEMSRFMMSIEESAGLVIDSLVKMLGGEIFVTQMPVLRVGDLAEVLIEELAPIYGHSVKDYPISVIGARIGEKLYEELTTEEEIPRSYEFDKLIVVIPALRNIYDTIDYSYYEKKGQPMKQVYHSHHETKMTKDEIRDFLRDLGVFSQEEKPQNSQMDKEADLKRFNRGFSSGTVLVVVTKTSNRCDF